MAADRRKFDLNGPINGLEPAIVLPGELCRDLRQAVRREWLVTNGIGGFASGTIAGALTRRYHGLLLAALRPPVGRTLLVAGLLDTAQFAGVPQPLFTNIWRDGAGPDPGCRRLAGFALVLGVPTWDYELPGPGGPARLRKRIWMEPGANRTYVRYDLAGGGTVELNAVLLVNCRDYHALRHRDDAGLEAQPAREGVQWIAAGHPAGYAACFGGAGRPDWTGEQTWYRDFRLPVEEARGFDHFEDHLAAGQCRARLAAGRPLVFVLSAEPIAPVGADEALQRCQAAARQRLSEFEQHARLDPGPDRAALPQLALAADQFLVRRPALTDRPAAEIRTARPGERIASRTATVRERQSPNDEAGETILAGYPWFTDWGRDTMIALPGLTLSTGRPDVARRILLTWARYVDGGMIPNRFPDAGQQPEYHSADATLWFLHAIHEYWHATQDRPTLATLFPVMREIVAAHLRGTRHHLHVDADGLVYAGQPGVNLTWMDAKVGDRVITPRMGKPIELSALWYDALCHLARLAAWLAQPADEYARLAERTRASFARYWNPARGCCYDVLDGPEGDEARIRPNQIFAVCLAHSPLSPQQQAGVVAVCERELLIPFGLRTLAPSDPEYRGRYAGGPAQRDAVYHQGTAWGWLLGPFVLAHFRVHRDRARAAQLLRPMLQHLCDYGVGTLGEIFDGDPPHEPNGCFAQAWTVAQTLWAWVITQSDPRGR